MSSDTRYFGVPRKRPKHDGYDSSSDEEISRDGPSRYLGVQFNSANSTTNQTAELDNNEAKPFLGMSSNITNSFMSAGNDSYKEDSALPSLAMSSMKSTQFPMQSSMRSSMIDSFNTGNNANKVDPQKTKADNAHVKSYGIGAKLLGKMGYVAGKGLGSEGKGIVEPIQQKLRPTLLGLGGIEEKTAQAKRDAARKKKAKKESGVEISDSDSDSPRPRVRQTRRAPKNIFKTMEEMEAEGLHVPAGFKSIIDMTQGGEGQLIEDLSRIRVSDDNNAPDTLHLYSKARQELEHFKKQWEVLGSRKDYASFEIKRLEDQLDVEAKKLEKLEKLDAMAKQLNDICSGNGSLDEFTGLIDQLRYEYTEEITEFPVKELAVSALGAYLPKILTPWSPLDDPTFFKQYFVRWKELLDEPESTYENSSSWFESLMLRVWMPLVSSSLLKTWRVEHPSSALLLIEEWSNVLPVFVKFALVDRAIVPTLKTALRHESTITNSETWIFPWFSYLNSEQQAILLSEVQLVLVDAMRKWSPKRTAFILQSTSQWKEIIGSDKLDQIISQSLLPKLIDYLRKNFTIDPSNQDMKPLEDVLGCSVVLRLSLIGRVLEEQFFPKFIKVLYQWLVAATEEQLPELSEWYQTWFDWFSQDIKDIPAVKLGFDRCLDLINRALDLPDRSTLSFPSTSANREPITTNIHSAPVAAVEIGTTFRDVVEEYCLEHDLFLIPQKKAHPILGHALYKVSPSPSGHGGLTVYLDDDILWVNSEKNRKSFGPISLEELADIV